MVALGPAPITGWSRAPICGDDDDVSGKLGGVLGSLKRLFGLNRGNRETRLPCTSILFLRPLRYCPFCLSREEATVVIPDCVTW